MILTHSPHSLACVPRVRYPHPHPRRRQMPDSETGFQFRANAYRNMGLPLQYTPPKRVLLMLRPGRRRQLVNEQAFIDIIESYGLPYTYVQRHACRCLAGPGSADNDVHRPTGPMIRAIPVFSIPHPPCTWG